MLDKVSQSSQGLPCKGVPGGSKRFDPLVVSLGKQGLAQVLEDRLQRKALVALIDGLLGLGDALPKFEEIHLGGRQVEGGALRCLPE
ncbi:MAG: hypothetical protein M9921_13275 [Fimbriimonadaceae bacterium]|nr:hypothetical protein [Fimbriimonadaceae bacterium]